MAMGMHMPLDPECPEVAEFAQMLETDPMVAWSGVGDDLAEDFERRHRQKCERCQLYGAANIEVGGP